MQEEKNTKMVIVMRKFKGLRTGKYASQACHASMAFLTKDIFRRYMGTMGSPFNHSEFINNDYDEDVKDVIQHWLENSFRKICVYVDSELELEDLHKRALDKGMISHMVEDNGATEFNGVKTKTCIAIGPAEDSKFFGLTDHLPLL
jgi:PTH2 family peptidyl-tRNA hydrolase